MNKILQFLNNFFFQQKHDFDTENITLDEISIVEEIIKTSAKTNKTSFYKTVLSQKNSVTLKCKKCNKVIQLTQEQFLKFDNKMYGCKK